jgi:magnesium-transporting ATPase (P-type)
MQSKKIISFLYKKIISLYPKRFKEQFSESMQQTFNDLYKEKQNTNQPLFNFITWMFIETSIGIFREHLLQGDIMKTSKRFISSALISFLLILPFAIMEIFNRWNYNEDFPFALFSFLWFNLFTVILILLPIVLNKWIKQDNTKSNLEQKQTLLTNPKSSLIISAVLILFIAILSLLSSIGLIPSEINSESILVFGIQVPIISGYVASMPIVRTLHSGGSLFAHPIHLTIIVVIAFLFTAGTISLIIDQWPCFIGVQYCD